MNIRPRPCAECPWVKTTEPGQFSAERFAALRPTTVGACGSEAVLGAAMFACHKSAEGEEMPCAGWLAAVGYESLTVRINLARGEIPTEAMEPGPDWPDLFETYDEMAAVMGG